MRRLRALSSLVIASACLAVSTTAASAQRFQVTGTVTEARGGALVDSVFVQLLGTNISVLTSSTGEYEINARSATDTLSFSHLGFVEESVAIANQGVVDVSLRRSPIDLSDLVMVPYGRSAGSSCGAIPDPMPGSAFDPNWQRAHPEMARVLLGECARLAPDGRTP